MSLAGNDGLASSTNESLLMLATGDDVARDRDGALLIKRHVDGVRGRDKKQRVAVGRSARDSLQREIAPGARPVLDHHRLAEPLRHCR